MIFDLYSFEFYGSQMKLVTIWQFLSFINDRINNKIHEKSFDNCNFMFVHRVSAKSVLKQYFYLSKIGLSPLITPSETLGFIKKTQSTGPYTFLFYSLLHYPFK